MSVIVAEITFSGKWKMVANKVGREYRHGRRLRDFPRDSPGWFERPFSSKVVDRSGHRYRYSFRLFSLSPFRVTAAVGGTWRGVGSQYTCGVYELASTGRGNAAWHGSARLSSAWPLNDVHRSGCTHSTSGTALFYPASSPVSFLFPSLSSSPSHLPSPYPSPRLSPYSSPYSSPFLASLLHFRFTISHCYFLLGILALATLELSNQSKWLAPKKDLKKWPSLDMFANEKFLQDIQQGDGKRSRTSWLYAHSML